MDNDSPESRPDDATTPPTARRSRAAAWVERAGILVFAWLPILVAFLFVVHHVPWFVGLPAAVATAGLGMLLHYLGSRLRR